MPSAPYIKRAANGTYYVHWTDKRIGRRVSTRSKSMDGAKSFLAHWLLIESAPPADKSAVLSLADVWSVYREKHVERKAASTYGADLAWAQMEPFFGHRMANEFNQTTIDAYVDQRTSGKLGRKVKPQTVTKELSYLRAAVKFCATDRIRLVDPAIAGRKLELPEQGEARDRWLTMTEMNALLTAAGRMRKGDRLSRGERFLWLALETAGRKQALLDLEWSRVDFDTRVIVLDVPGRKKTKKRRATVPISTALMPVLRRAYDERIGDLVLDNKGAIWPTIQHIAINAGLASKDLLPASGQKPKATGISPHVLRHTAATHMARKGVPLWLIAKILGNTIAVTEKTYAKHCPEDLRGPMDLISNGELEPAE